VITRHGDRTPAMSILPNEENVWYCDDAEEIIQLAPYLDGTEINAYRRHVVTPDRLAYPDTAWPGSNCRRGQLTRKGILQHVLLGQQLRRIYVEQLDVLPDKLDVKALTHLYFRSSDVQRTRQSAAALLSGLWPNDKRSKNIKITPISVYPKEAETMWGHLNECPRAAHLAQAIRESEMYMNFLDRHTALRSQLEMKLGTVDHKGFSGSFIRYSDAIYPRYCHGLPLPCGPNGCISEEEAELLSQCMSEEQSILRYQHPFSAEFNRLTLGHFLGELRERLLATVYRTTQDRVLGPTRFDLFSGHDVTIYTILGALHATDLRWPPYVSHPYLTSIHSNTSFRHPV
jgi:broad specificity phosphatase PhoE